MYGVDGDCEHPPTILHGEVQLIVNDDGTEASALYTCKPGYHLHGKSQRSCNLDIEKWLGDLPACMLGKSIIYR